MREIRTVTVQYKDGEVKEINPFMIAWREGEDDIALSIDTESSPLIIEASVSCLEQSLLDLDDALNTEYFTNLIKTFKDTLYGRLDEIFVEKEYSNGDT